MRTWPGLAHRRVQGWVRRPPSPEKKQSATKERIRKVMLYSTRLPATGAKAWIGGLNLYRTKPCWGKHGERGKAVPGAASQPQGAASHLDPPTPAVNESADSIHVVVPWSWVGRSQKHHPTTASVHTRKLQQAPLVVPFHRPGSVLGQVGEKDQTDVHSFLAFSGEYSPGVST